MLLRRIALLAGLVLTAAGCSSKSPYTSSLSGKVTCNGQPVKAGLVILHYENGQYESPLREDGGYEFLDLPQGPVKVVVDNRAFDPDQKSPVYGAQQKSTNSGYNSSFSQYNKVSGGGTMNKREEGESLVGLSKEQKAELSKLFVKIPVRYASVKTTSLAHNVEKGSQTKDFDLTD